MTNKFHLKLAIGIMFVATLAIYLLRRVILPTWIGFGWFGDTELGFFAPLKSMRYPIEADPALPLIYNLTQPVCLIIMLGIAVFVSFHAFPKLPENKKFTLPIVSGAIYLLFLGWFVVKVFTSGFEL